MNHPWLSSFRRDEWRSPSLSGGVLIAALALAHLATTNGCSSGGPSEAAGGSSSRGTLCQDPYCGPSRSPCCADGAQCTAGAGGNATSCTCDGLMWDCGAAPTCTDPACGPQGAPCCNEGTSCESGACTCTGRVWQCDGGTSGTGGVGGGTGGSGGAGGTGGTQSGACVDYQCGPTATPCCEAGASCPASNGSQATCLCDGTTWDCGPATSCEDAHCGPSNSPCCQDDSVCGLTDNGSETACSCQSGLWSCWDTATGGSGGNGNANCMTASCGPDGSPCCHAGTTCSSQSDGVGGTPAGGEPPPSEDDCVCDGTMWHCAGGDATQCTDSACGPTYTPCCSDGAHCNVNGSGNEANAYCDCTNHMWSCAGYTGVGGS